LAANQVGVLRRVVTIDTGNGLIELINPEIIAKKGRQEETEGCLSFPGEYYVTKRPFWVRVRAQDRNGKIFETEGEGLAARAFCHELDHLDGVLYMDRMIRKINVRQANVRVKSDGKTAEGNN
ncbi:MAG TPA: peptide deformylase, partial [Ruminococcaceae bacterium]|nr:peptide deformylase [Oscillospiraceae bacterium]